MFHHVGRNLLDQLKLLQDCQKRNFPAASSVNPPYYFLDFFHAVRHEPRVVNYDNVVVFSLSVNHEQGLVEVRTFFAVIAMFSPWFRTEEKDIKVTPRMRNNARRYGIDLFFQSRRIGSFIKDPVLEKNMLNIYEERYQESLNSPHPLAHKAYDLMRVNMRVDVVEEYFIQLPCRYCTGSHLRFLYNRDKFELSWYYHINSITKDYICDASQHVLGNFYQVIYNPFVLDQRPLDTAGRIRYNIWKDVYMRHKIKWARTRVVDRHEKAVINGFSVDKLKEIAQNRRGTVFNGSRRSKFLYGVEDRSQDPRVLSAIAFFRKYHDDFDPFIHNESSEDPRVKAIMDFLKNNPDVLNDFS